MLTDGTPPENEVQAAAQLLQQEREERARRCALEVNAIFERMNCGFQVEPYFKGGLLQTDVRIVAR